MDAALELVGLPVKCAFGDCKTRGFVKPATDYGGWFRRSFKKWYCTEHAKVAKEVHDRIAETYKTPEPKQDTTEELYKLLD